MLPSRTSIVATLFGIAVAIVGVAAIQAHEIRLAHAQAGPVVMR